MEYVNSLATLSDLMNNIISNGIILKQESERDYIVRLADGEMKTIRLSLKQLRNYSSLFAGAKVFVEVSTFNKNECRLLTSTDFKINGWSGWTLDFEPNPKL